MKLFNVLKQPQYFLIFIVSSMAFSAIYIYSQVLGIVENIILWITIIPWYNAILFVVFVALFGITLSFQIYNWRQPKTCSINQKRAGASVGGIASFVGLLVAQCPACASLGVLFLPFSAVTFLTEFSTALNLLSIGLLLFTINYLGGFKK